MTLRIIVNCGPCEDYIGQCLTSLRGQTVIGWEALVTIDPCGDGTVRAAETACAGDPRIHIAANAERRYAMANLVASIGRSGAGPDDVIVILDGDDWFATDRALERILAEYRDPDCWLTYGSWIANDPSRIGFKAGRWPAYDPGTTDFRTAPWLGTAVRSWRRFLWDRIDDRDFRDADGAYFRMVEDQASMLPMLEMAGTARARHIPDVLMVYNRLNPHGCGKTNLALMRETEAYIRALPPYPRLARR